jgi:hypothetical protein
LTSYVPEPGGPAGFCERLGFVPAGGVNGDGEAEQAITVPSGHADDCRPVEGPGPRLRSRLAGTRGSLSADKTPVRCRNRCHAGRVPCVASLDTLHRAVAEFAVTDPGLVIEPPALAATRRSLDSAGLLLLGEVHGVRENPLLIRALMQALGLTGLALEWPGDLAPIIRAFLAGQPLADHWFVWGGDGRISAGHLAVLAERAAAGPLDLILFDGVTGEGWSWSQRDEAMARRILAASGPDARTLAVAGNAHTPTSPTELGVPMGARQAATTGWGYSNVPGQRCSSNGCGWNGGPVRPLPDTAGGSASGRYATRASSSSS